MKSQKILTIVSLVLVAGTLGIVLYNTFKKEEPAPSARLAQPEELTIL